MKLLGRYYTDARVAGRTYDIAADGRRFLMIKAPGGGAVASTPSLIVVQHFDEELKRGRCGSAHRLGRYGIQRL